MIQTAKAIAVGVLLGALGCQPCLGQSAPGTIIQIDVENFVSYIDDVSEFSRRATDPNVTTAANRTFGQSLLIGDIVAVNGQTAKGTMTIHARSLITRTAPTPGQAIADTERSGVVNQTFEILKADGTPIGSIFASGLAFGTPPPGAPLAVTQTNTAIVGGTGAFLGVRGQLGSTVTPPFTSVPRFASMAEDPANRRRHGGGAARYYLHLFPLFRPEIAVTPMGPAVTHSNDFTLVTASRPAVPGEVLSLFATGLGPTRPGVDPGQPFPASPLAVVNSPIEVIVNGRAAEVSAAVGFQGAVDGYQVNFRVPAEAASGTATVQLRVAWIIGPEVRIAVR